MERICRTIGKPLIANMVEGGRTPVMTGAQLEALGYRIAIFPATGYLAMAAALRSAYGEILAKGSSAEYQGELYPFPDFTRLMGFERVWEFEKRHPETT